MANYSINTTAARDAALQTYTTERNAERAADNPPKAPLTSTEFLQRRINGMLDDWASDQKERLQIKTIKDALPTATDAQIAAIKTTLGI